MIVDEATQRVDLFPDGLKMIFSFYIKEQKLKGEKRLGKLSKCVAVTNAMEEGAIGTFSLLAEHAPKKELSSCICHMQTYTRRQPDKYSTSSPDCVRKSFS